MMSYNSRPPGGGGGGRRQQPQQQPPQPIQQQQRVRIDNEETESFYARPTQPPPQTTASTLNTAASGFNTMTITSSNKRQSINSGYSPEPSPSQSRARSAASSGAAAAAAAAAGGGGPEKQQLVVLSSNDLALSPVHRRWLRAFEAMRSTLPSVCVNIFLNFHLQVYLIFDFRKFFEHINYIKCCYNKIDYYNLNNIRINFFKLN